MLIGIRDFQAQVNFRGPWENICTFWHYLQILLNQTLPILTLPDQIENPRPGAPLP